MTFVRSSLTLTLLYHDTGGNDGDDEIVHNRKWKIFSTEWWHRI